jgi:thymidylate kinase
LPKKVKSKFHLMLTDRAIFIKAFFQWLSTREYLWLKAVPECPENTPEHSDIDLFIQEKDQPAALLFICGQTSVSKCEVAQKPAVTYLQLSFNDGSQLKLDLLTALVRKQFCYLPEKILFAHRVWRNGVATYAPKILLEHALLFNFLNNAGLPLKYIEHFGAMTDQEQAKAVGYINDKYHTAFGNISQMGRFSINEQNKCWEYLRQLVWGRKTGFPKVITFTGVDGAGKTSLLHDLKSVLTNKFGQRVVVLRHRPSLLPMLSAVKHGRQGAEEKSAAALPRQGNNQNTFSSLLRFSYYYTDYLLGQLYVWMRYLLPGRTVIYDRYYFDFIVDGRRSNISLGEGLPKWLYRFVAKPGLSIFLYADPDTIRQRKQELPKADIVAMTQQYLALFDELQKRYGGKYICLENEDRSTTLNAILEAYFSMENEGGHFPNREQATRNHQQPFETALLAS